MADYRFDFVPVSVTIVSDDGKGHAGKAISMYGESLDAKREDRLVSLLAGHAAQLEWARRTLDHGNPVPIGTWCGAHDDLEDARDLLSEGESIRGWMRKARAFIKKEWPAVEAVAKELLIWKTLDDAEIEALVVSTDGDASAMDDLRRYRWLKGHSDRL